MSKCVCVCVCVCVCYLCRAGRRLVSLRRSCECWSHILCQGIIYTMYHRSTLLSQCVQTPVYMSNNCIYFRTVFANPPSLALYPCLPLSLSLSSSLSLPPSLSLSLSRSPQYLGSTSVTRTHGTGSTDEAVKTIVQDVSLTTVNP